MAVFPRMEKRAKLPLPYSPERKNGQGKTKRRSHLDPPERTDMQNYCANCTENGKEERHPRMKSLHPVVVKNRLRHRGVA